MMELTVLSLEKPIAILYVRGSFRIALTTKKGKSTIIGARMLNKTLTRETETAQMICA